MEAFMVPATSTTTLRKSKPKVEFSYPIVVPAKQSWFAEGGC